MAEFQTWLDAGLEPEAAFPDPTRDARKPVGVGNR